jgi:hypothetical protein
MTVSLAVTPPPVPSAPRRTGCGPRLGARSPLPTQNYCDRDRSRTGRALVEPEVTVLLSTTLAALFGKLAAKSGADAGERLWGLLRRLVRGHPGRSGNGAGRRRDTERLVTLCSIGFPFATQGSMARASRGRCPGTICQGGAMNSMNQPAVMVGVSGSAVARGAVARGAAR